MPGPGRKKKAFFAAIVLVAILAAAETVLRLHDFSFYVNFGADILGMPLIDLHSARRTMNRTVEFDPYLFWRFKPDQTLRARGVYKEPVRINSMGFRGREFEEDKPEGTLRVACIGDSTTFGWSVGEGESYPPQLEQMLSRACDKRIEVLNLGVTGYTSLQGRELMKREVKDWKPDAVVFAFGPNDRLPAMRSDLEHLEDRTWDIGPVTVFLHRFQVYKLMKAGVVYLGNLAQGLRLEPRTYIPRLKRKVSQEEFANNVRQVKDMCDRIGAGLVLVHVDYPSLPPDHPGREVERLAGEHGAEMPRGWERWDGRKLVESLSRQLHVPALDLRTLFSEKLSLIEKGMLDPERAQKIEQRMPELIEAEPWRYLMVDNGHPSPWGHEMIARRLARKIILMPRFNQSCTENME